ncbi:glycosyltransferase family 4 protein [Microlunatus parietis]|uniref:Glycosyltransferase involved in cell wall biosynthesis n=1 Tax=Microlunatus parietis TaxID=682979 RepID=A0A7Y9IFC9_9ACTN|nr:glycosyltransferase family 4 protein [Microlunatus parietis]NYE75488.1 glycosyltransferase involved in cell wall biosynthesis [Microlunatus parietis]
MLPDSQPLLRVGYVVKMYPRFSETFIVTELLELERLGLDLTVFSLRLPNDGRFHPALAEVRAPVHYLRHSGIRADDLWQTVAGGTALPGFTEALPDLLRLDAADAHQAVQLAVAVREQRITHLHAHFASISAAVARVAARLAGIGYSLTAHAKDIFHADVDHDRLRERLADATRVITVSDFNHDHLRRTFGAAADRVERLYNGIDLRRFQFTDPADRVRDTPVIAAVGRLVEKKGFADLIDAAALLRDAGRRFRVDLAGTGPLAAELQARIDRHRLGGVVRLLGALPQSAVARLVGAADVFAAPCVVGSDGNRDGLPTVVLEAMALGTPVVATDVTGLPEIVEDGRTGLMIEQHDPAGLAAALARLLDAPELRSGLAKAARDLIEIEFDAARQAAKLAAGFRTSGRG